jgi:hypothetical protein
MKLWQYTVLEFNIKEGDSSVDIEIQMDSYGRDGFELKSTSVVGDTLFIFLMREKS